MEVNPLGSVLSTLGVIMGVASLVAVLALGDGMERFARDQIARTTPLQAVAVAPRAGRMVDGVFVPEGDVPTLTDVDARAVAQLPGVRDVALTVRGPALVTRRDAAAPRGAMVTGAFGAVGRLGSPRLQAGRFFTDAEAVAGARVVVLSNQLARALGAGHAPPAALVGDSVQFQGVGFRVRRARARSCSSCSWARSQASRSSSVAWGSSVSPSARIQRCARRDWPL